MRAARRIIVLAGILALAVCAPITWTQAGAQSDGESPQITFVKIMCADFGVIPANYAMPTTACARPDGTTLGLQHRSGKSRSEESHPGGCQAVDGWDFVLGAPDNVIADPGHGGNMVDPSLEPSPAPSH